MKVITQTNFPDLKLFHRGKVRDIYDLGENFLFVATDRISAFDVVFNEGIPYKGYVLTQLSIFWFDYLKNVCDNHLVASKVDDFPIECQKYKNELEGRSLLVKKVKIFPVECIVRGFISGSAWSEYQKSKTVCGLPIEQQMVESEKFNEVLFTPSTKAEIGLHDENISYAQMVEIIGESDSRLLKDLSIKIYTSAYEYALQKGIIIADTKFEFGSFGDKILLADEVLTPDSSRFWLKDSYKPGSSQVSLDKQYVRDYLIKINFNKKPPAPPLPDEIIQATSDKYLEILKILTS